MRLTDESIQDIAGPLAYVIANDPASSGENKSEKAMIGDARAERLALLKRVMENDNDTEAEADLKRVTQAMVSCLSDMLSVKSLEQQRQSILRMLNRFDKEPADEVDASALNMDVAVLYQVIFSDDTKLRHANALRTLGETTALLPYISSGRNPPVQRGR